MCWSMRSSFMFSCLGLVMTLDQTRRYLNLPKDATLVQKGSRFSIIILYLTYFLMESLQFFQYYFGLTDSCNTDSNKYLTIVAHLLIWGQPLSHNYYCLRNTLKGKSVFRFTLVACVLCLIVSTISLYMGYYGLGGHSKSTNDQSAFDLLKASGQSTSNLEITPNAYGTEAKLFGVPLQNIGSSMCSYQGPNHLYWMFPYHQLWGYSVHWGTWQLFFILPHFFRYQGTDDWFLSSRILGWGLFSGWVLSVIISLNFGVFHEIWSYWCLESVPYLTLPYVYRFVWRGLLGWKDPEHASEFLHLEKRLALRKQQ